MVFKCCPISRTISYSVLSNGLGSISPLMVVLWGTMSVPFCWADDDGIWSSSVAPLCCWVLQPFAGCCIVDSKEGRDFFRGGGASPPSSDSPLSARLANGTPWRNFVLLTDFPRKKFVQMPTVHSTDTDDGETKTQTVVALWVAVAALRFCHTADYCDVINQYMDIDRIARTAARDDAADWWRRQTVKS